VEVDLLIDHGEHVTPVEIKSGKTVAKDFFSGIDKLIALAGKITRNPSLIYGGEDCYTHKGINVYSWKKAGEISLSD
jgi:hypothetical protein